ncbi:hypothetical protein [Actinocatenispora comari]|uniref:hypothetical protein n=1 Tax=Actinocatenispora comari TaxID=2807577 RepID=UPI001A913626|nr:hypothetical protein [Actinocatenispora comari]
MFGAAGGCGGRADPYVLPGRARPMTSPGAPDGGIPGWSAGRGGVARPYVVGCVGGLGRPVVGSSGRPPPYVVGCGSGSLSSSSRECRPRGGSGSSGRRGDP